MTHNHLEKSGRKRSRDEMPADQDPIQATEQGPTGWEALETISGAMETQEKGAIKAPKLSKHAKHRLRVDREKQIRAAELKPKGAPTSIPEFEQRVIASPNSSIMWIRYMAFLVNIGDIEKAAAVAKRAIASINYREDTERFNVWVAWLNIESNYGTDDSTRTLIKSAIPHVDAMRFYLVAIDILEKTGKDALAEECIQEVCRKYSDSPEPWLRSFKYQLVKGDGETAQHVLNRSLLSLPTFDHVGFKSKAGLLEYKLGDAERGRSIFENLLHDNPRRLDLWSIYIDQEIAHGDEQRIRSIFERATHIHLPPKKMKFLFKRYLEFEKQFGDATRVAHVKQRAMEYVERALAN